MVAADFTGEPAEVDVEELLEQAATSSTRIKTLALTRVWRAMAILSELFSMFNGETTSNTFRFPKVNFREHYLRTIDGSTSLIHFLFSPSSVSL
jgi:hypothetical protein